MNKRPLEMQWHPGDPDRRKAVRSDDEYTRYMANRIRHIELLLRRPWWKKVFGVE